MAPGERDVDVPGSGPASASFVPPLRPRRTADGAVEPEAVVGAQARNLLLYEVLGPGSVEVKPETSPGPDRIDVVDRHVDAGGLDAPGVYIGAGDEPAAHPERAGQWIAVYQVAELARGDALCYRSGRRNDADGVVDLDPPVVDRCAQVPHRLDDDAKRIGLRLFRVEGGIAALQIVVLTRRVGKKGTAELGGWESRRQALCQRRRGWAAERTGPAGVGTHVEEVETRRQEQLDDVRGAYGLLVAAAEPGLPHRCPLGADPVGVGRLVGAVIRIPVAAVDAQQLRPRAVLDDRHLHFGVNFLHGISAVDRQGRTALAREVEASEFQIGCELELLDAALGAECDTDAVLGPGEPPVIHPQVGRHRAADDALLGKGLLHSGHRQVVDCRWRHTPEVKDIPRHAGRVEAADSGCARRAVGRRHYIEGSGDAYLGKVVQVGVLEHDLAHLIPDVVIPAFGERERDVSLESQHTAVRCMPPVVDAPAAFDVAAPDQYVPRRGRGDAERALEGAGQQRIIEVEQRSQTAEEQTAGRDLRQRAVVHELEFRVCPCPRCDVVVGEEVSQIALVGALIKVKRGEIELVEGGGKRPHVAGGVGDGE